MAGVAAWYTPESLTAMTFSELQSRLQAVRSQYRVTPWIQPREDEGPLLRSWQRCVAAGMRDHEQVHFELVSRSWLAELDDRCGALVRRARPEVERLAQALRGTGCAVLLFDDRGVVVDRICHEAAASPALLTATRVGVNAAERCLGTTAPGIVLHERLPYLVGRDAHFFANTRPFFCTAAPIDSPAGEPLAVLDVTCHDHVPPFDVFSLVMDAAAAIENAAFRPSAYQLVLQFHPRAELLGTALAGLVLVHEAGRIEGVNRTAARLLGSTRAALIGRHFGDLFGRRPGPLFAGARSGPGLVELETPQGLLVAARFEGGAASPEAVAPQDEGSLREIEIRTIQAALDAVGGNVSVAARRLGISRNTIYRRLRWHGNTR